jgi:DNA-binding NarL/FixJ family response regulator
VELTCREWEVLTMMYEGLSTADTAQRLFVSPVTVRRHVSAVVRKLGVQDREAALRLMRDFV